MWCKIKKIDPSYRQFLTPKQLSDLGLLPIQSEVRENKNIQNTEALNQQQLTADPSDEDTIILVIPPYEDLQSESPDCYRSPHKIP